MREPEDRPLPPPKPLPQDCCGTGCIPCVMDLYEEAMEDHRQALAQWEARQNDRLQQA